MTKALSRLKQVEAEFIAEIQKNGLPHALQWIGSWYDRTAQAEVEDRVDSDLGEHAKDQTARHLLLVDRLLPDAESVTNLSSSAGHNQYRAATVAAYARLLNDSRFTRGTTSPFSPAGRREMWQQWRAENLTPAKDQQ